jgi:ABC-type Fe3+-hydroxamate transport system substrate-binding protein
VPPQSIVSLVPSLTETLFSYGLGERLVGRTRYCVEPVGEIERVEAVGGTKNPDVERILGLAPDLVVVNKEENRLEDYERLRDAGLEVWVCHPRTVEEAADVLADLGRIAGAQRTGEELAARVRDAAKAAHGAASLRQGRAARVFCPIWRNPWMTFGPATYVNDVLRTIGLENVFAPDAAGDFFEVDLAEARARTPDLVLLPDEPYAFSLDHAQELCDRGFTASVAPIDGRDLSWYGPRLPGALERLALLASHILSTSGI